MIKITDIANILADRHELSQADANAFVTTLFSVIEDGLRTDDRQVKVKGLGTFKVTSVSPRESVDVNTGERIVIEGREKIVFTPDAILRDRVNRPFSQFETVTLRDDVNFSEIDKAFEQETPVITETPKVSEEETKTIAPSVPSEEDNPRSQEPTTTPESSGTTTTETDEVTTTTEAPTKDVVDEEVSTPTKTETPTETETLTETEAKAIEVEEDTDKPALTTDTPRNHKNRLEGIQQIVTEGQHTSPYSNSRHNDEDEYNDDEEQPHNTLAIWLTAIIIILLLLGGAGGGYLWHELSVRNDSLAVLQTRLIDIEERIHHAKTATHTAKKEPVATSVPVDTTTKDKTTPTTPTEKTVPATTQPEKTSAAYDKDVRIRTGAYKIVGIDKTVTVKTGQTLASIARSYLGPGMECYVEAVNENREYKTGDRVKLPKLELKKAAKKK